MKISQQSLKASLDPSIYRRRNLLSPLEFQAVKVGVSQLSCTTKERVACPFFEGMGLTAMLRFGIYLFLAGLILWSCETAKFPKPKAYPRVELPDTGRYDTLDCAICPMRLAYPAYAKLHYVPKDSCWFDLYFPQLDAYWHITAHDLEKLDKTPQKALEIYRKLIYKHAIRATDIIEKSIRSATGKGFFYEIYGEAPTHALLFYTDSVRYALMIASYFKVAGAEDSLAPIIDRMKYELLRIYPSITWRPVQLTHTRTCF